MTGQWIEAQRAKVIVGDTFALCERLHAGVLQARARIFTHDQDQRVDCAIPQKFWWACGHEALEQDWVNGDFSTWIDHSLHLKALGVQIELSGILEMVPSENRGAIARSLSIAGNPEWLPASNAIALVAPHALRPARFWEVRLMDAARLGFITAKAVEARAGNDGFKSWLWSEREWNIPPWFWELFTKQESSRQDFERGMLRGRGHSPMNLGYVELHGVHFLRSDIEAFVIGTDSGAVPVLRQSIAPTPTQATLNCDSNQNSTKALPRLPESKLQEWWEGKVLVRESLTQGELLTLVRAAFLTHEVARDRIRELSGNRKRGPKSFGG